MAGKVVLAAIAASVLGASIPAAADTPNPAASGSLIGPALHVSDVARALKFYVDGLGMKVGLEMGPSTRHETILTFGGDPRQPGIILLSDKTAKAPPQILQSNGYDRTVLRIEDLAATAERLRAAGFVPGEIRDAAMGYRIMMATDPDGYRYELVQMAQRKPTP
ncbi:VOC family protein [Novosphingobium sp. PS1R-30]|uniref:VOC family protein n=1 Tax=Novosphingobium anseongense TaxID=3133436 RepID=A0ABU8RYW0_9SPHN|nr:MAG: VOC family protein [Novosphingobium sp.]